MSARDAIEVQRRAADPKSSASVTANAGSGKTKTLVDRVARLLLAGVEPERILCITYTKAAAAEMQNRLFETLGKWSVREDTDLRKDLAELENVPAAAFDHEELSAARRLFALALEAPGGLKIQTIHAFCEKLLRRFPIEAAVSPGFKVMDDRDGAEIVAEAQTRVAEMAMAGPGLMADAYARLTIALDFGAFQDMFADFEARRTEIAAYIAGCDGEVPRDVWRRCGFDGPEPVDEILAEAAIDPGLWRSAADVLKADGGTNDAKLADKLLKAAASGDLADALAALFTEGGDGTPVTQVGKTKALAAREDLRQALLDDQTRLEEARERLRAARIAEDTVHALVLAQAYVDAYAEAKRSSGALDFADLIARTCELLTVRADAAWVLYKLDGGIDHILLDEAQDTAPEQWRIVQALTGEFFAGAGAEPDRALERTLFIVGDEKQSIYSFQGADPDQLRLQTGMYHELIQGSGGRSERLSLLTSFRSTLQVLAFVDATFADRDRWPGVPPPDGEEVVRHLLHRDHAGCVDLWALEQEKPGAERDAWTQPLDEESDLGANRRLAEKIAAEIKALVERGDLVHDRNGPRGAHYGDVLILVRRRKALFEEILRALKRRDVPVAGADRLSLSAHIAFDDFLALARFVQHPDDDLTLAALLKSPLLGVDEDGLFRLAYGRGDISLWRTLQARAEEDPSWGFALATLRRALAEAPLRRPFDFFSRLLGWTGPNGRSMRAEILTRLGPEAEEVLDEFLSQTLSAERAGIADLERLAADFAGLDITVKRELEGARHQVRVMTVHGAKGLEAPIVILPETTLTRGARGPALLATGDGGFLWAPTKAKDCDVSRAARERLAEKDEQETQRLFYVALTRARDRLVLCGRQNATGKRETAKDWYAPAEAAFASEALANEVRELDGGTRRVGPDPAQTAAWTPGEGEAAALPAWATARPAPEAAPRIVSPSRLGDEAPDLGPAPSPLARTGGLGRYRRGDLIHRLLQLLPDITPAEREAAALRLLARERDLTDAQRQEMTGAALGVLNDAQFAAVFGPGSRAEVAVAGLAPGVGPISGRVDRLVVEPDRVLVVDFKTNRPAPARIEDADPAYLAQMAVYVGVLKTIFPDRRVEAALVWTDGPRLMPAPENLTVEALSRLARSVDT